MNNRNLLRRNKMERINICKPTQVECEELENMGSEMLRLKNELWQHRKE